MAKKKTPITVILKKGKHPTQPWTFVIDEPGPGPKLTVRERYASGFTAKRGAVRKLGGYTQRGYDPKNGRYYTVAHFTQDMREIVFVNKKSR